MVSLILLVVIGTSIWVFVDAPARGLSWTWGLGSLAFWIIAFPLYLVERGKAQPKAVTAQPAPVARMERPPGWYPDPYSAKGQRWWDGYNWTEHAR